MAKDFQPRLDVIHESPLSFDSQTKPQPTTSLINWIKHARDDLLDILHNREISVNVINTPDDDGVYPIQYAVITRDIELCKALIDSGSKVSYLTPIENRNLLHLAAYNNANRDMRNLLASSGVRMKAQDVYGDTPLVIASAFEMTAFLEGWEEDLLSVLKARVELIMGTDQAFEELKCCGTTNSDDVE